MPISLSDLTKKERTVGIHFDGVDTPLTVTYRPDRWTPSSQVEYSRLFADNKSGSALAFYVASRVVQWDLVDDAGAAIPLTETALDAVDIVVLDRVVAGIMDDMRPKATDPK